MLALADCTGDCTGESPVLIAGRSKRSESKCETLARIIKKGPNEIILLAARTFPGGRSGSKTDFKVKAALVQMQHIVRRPVGQC